MPANISGYTVLIDEDELSGQFLMDGWMGILVGLTLCICKIEAF
jgi:hypothetical protein